VLALFLLVVACLGVAVALLVVRADPGRWDNRVFAALAILDSALTLVRCAAVFTGHQLCDRAYQDVGADASILLAWATVEFSWSFPFNRPMPWKLRAPGLAWAAAMLAIASIKTWTWFTPYSECFYFVPTVVIALYLLARNYRRLPGRHTGIALVVGALMFRWSFAIVTYNFAWRFGREVFNTFLSIEATYVAIAGNMLMLYAILRNHFFSVRGVVAEVVLHASFGLAVLGLTSVGIELAFQHAPSAGWLRVLLLMVVLVPLALVAIARRFRAPVEDALLRRIDPRRALRKSVLERVMESAESASGEPEALSASTCRALAEVAVGGEVRYLAPAQHGGDLPPALASHFATSRASYLYRAEAHALDDDAAAELRATPGDLFVPVRGRRKPHELYGVLAVSGGKIDHESMVAAVTLASHLALTLENRALGVELERSQRLAALGAFAAAIAHDIRTPLTSVQMSVQILRGKVSLPADDLEYFDIALEELKRLNRHISELLDYAKPVMLNVARLELRELVDDAAKAIAPILSERRIALEQQHAEVLPPVLADGQRMRQVLWNLLDNAAKASVAGGAIVVRTRAADDGRTAIEIADSGRGIEARDLARIFEPFFTTRPDGTGLGLAICRKLVQAHAGEIVVRSAPGAGSTFTILLPAA
jgi:signal transduction histidine kinase